VNVRTLVSSPKALLPSLLPARPGLLQRRCACGSTPGLTGGCGKYGRNKLQCASLSPRGRESGLSLSKETEGEETVPPLVHEVLRSPSQPLDPVTRAFMESRFGHDFSRVRIHTDARATESARAVSALAYTVGRDVVFDARQYAPGTKARRQLLAHELTHVLQQSSRPFAAGATVQMGAPADAYEQQADTFAVTLSTRGPTGISVGSIPQTKLAAQREVSLEGTQTDSATKVDPGPGAPDKENDCSGWQSDQQSTSKVAAEHYVRTELGLLLGSVETIECDPPPMPYMCHVHFRGGLVVSVTVHADRITVAVSPTGTPQPNAPFCTYDYRCPPSGGLVLKRRECV
jgi:hypothetical protein